MDGSGGRWRARRVALAAGIAFGLAVLTQFVDYGIYPDYSDTELCNTFPQECGRAHAYWAVFITSGVLALVSLILIMVAIARAIPRRNSAL